jgi:hypothetical protein
VPCWRFAAVGVGARRDGLLDLSTRSLAMGSSLQVIRLRKSVSIPLLSYYQDSAARGSKTKWDPSEQPYQRQS